MKGEGMFDERDVLLKAASRVEEEGMWCQGTWYSLPKYDEAKHPSIFQMAERLRSAGRRVPECLEGAVMSAALDLAHSPEAARTLANAAHDRLFAAGILPVGFNDAPGRTAHQVAEAVRRAAL